MKHCRRKYSVAVGRLPARFNDSLNASSRSSIAPIQPDPASSTPSRSCRKSVERAERKKRNQRLLHDRAQPDRLAPRAAVKRPVEYSGRRAVRRERRVDRERHVEFAALREQHVVFRVAVNDAVMIERIDPRAFAAVLTARSSSAAEPSGSSSVSCAIGTSRPDESRQKSAIQRLYARAYARLSSGSCEFHFPQQSDRRIQQRASRFSCFSSCEPFAPRSTNRTACCRHNDDRAADAGPRRPSRRECRAIP